MKRLLVLFALCAIGILSMSVADTPQSVSAYEAIDCDQTAAKTCAVWQGSRVILKPGGKAYLYDDPQNPYTTTRVIGSPYNFGCSLIVDSAPDNPSRVAGAVTGAIIGPRDEDFNVLQSCPKAMGSPTTPAPGCYYDESGSWVCPPTSYPPPPSYPCTSCPPSGTWSPGETSEWKYMGGQDYGNASRSFNLSAGYNEIVVFTTGPITHRGWSFPGGTERGSVVILLGPFTNETVYLPYGGWGGRYTAKNTVDSAWRSLLDAKIGDMRQSANCSTGRGCRYIDTLVVKGYGSLVEVSQPRGPYY